MFYEECEGSSGICFVFEIDPDAFSELLEAHKAFQLEPFFFRYAFNIKGSNSNIIEIAGKIALLLQGFPMHRCSTR